MHFQQFSQITVLRNIAVRSWLNTQIEKYRKQTQALEHTQARDESYYIVAERKNQMQRETVGNGTRATASSYLSPCGIVATGLCIIQPYHCDKSTRHESEIVMELTGNSCYNACR